jgi:hypothetical protein
VISNTYRCDLPSGRLIDCKHDSAKRSASCTLKVQQSNSKNNSRNGNTAPGISMTQQSNGRNSNGMTQNSNGRSRNGAPPQTHKSDIVHPSEYCHTNAEKKACAQCIWVDNFKDFKNINRKELELSKNFNGYCKQM